MASRLPFTLHLSLYPTFDPGQNSSVCRVIWLDKTSQHIAECFSRGLQGRGPTRPTPVIFTLSINATAIGVLSPQKKKGTRPAGWVERGSGAGGPQAWLRPSHICLRSCCLVFAGTDLHQFLFTVSCGVHPKWNKKGMDAFLLHLPENLHVVAALIGRKIDGAC